MLVFIIGGFKLTQRFSFLYERRKAEKVSAGAKQTMFVFESMLVGICWMVSFALRDANHRLFLSKRLS